MVQCAVDILSEPSAALVPPIGTAIHRLNSVTSTNDVLRALIDQGEGHGAVVVADVQTSGRGRRGRSWQAPSGTGLLFSTYVTEIPAHLVAVVAALAARRAVESSYGANVDIKWPNDLLLNQRKFCGILSEQHARGVIVGVGINVSMPPADLAQSTTPATSLVFELGCSVDRDTLLASVLGYMERCYTECRREPGATFRAWRAALGTIGRQVEVREAQHTWLGQAVDVAPDGALLVTRDKRIARVYAADVSIRYE